MRRKPSTYHEHLLNHWFGQRNDPDTLPWVREKVRECARLYLHFVRFERGIENRLRNEKGVPYDR